MSAKFSQRLNWIHHETQQHLANIDQMPMSRRHLPIEQMLPILCLSYVSSIHWAKICRMFMRWLGCKLWLMYSSIQVAQITAITANDYAVKLMHFNARWTFDLPSVWIIEGLEKSSKTFIQYSPYSLAATSGMSTHFTRTVVFNCKRTLILILRAVGMAYHSFMKIDVSDFIKWTLVTML